MSQQPALSILGQYGGRAQQAASQGMLRLPQMLQEWGQSMAGQRSQHAALMARIAMEKQRREAQQSQQIAQSIQAGLQQSMRQQFERQQLEREITGRKAIEKLRQHAKMPDDEPGWQGQNILAGLDKRIEGLRLARDEEMRAKAVATDEDAKKRHQQAIDDIEAEIKKTIRQGHDAFQEGSPERRYMTQRYGSRPQPTLAEPVEIQTIPEKPWGARLMDWVWPIQPDYLEAPSRPIGPVQLTPYGESLVNPPAPLGTMIGGGLDQARLPAQTFPMLPGIGQATMTAADLGPMPDDLATLLEQYQFPTSQPRTGQLPYLAPWSQ